VSSAKHINTHLQSYMNLHDMSLAPLVKLLKLHIINEVVQSYQTQIVGHTSYYTCLERMQQAHADGRSLPCLKKPILCSSVATEYALGQLNLSSAALTSNNPTLWKTRMNPSLSQFIHTVQKIETFNYVLPVTNKKDSSSSSVWTETKMISTYSGNKTMMANAALP
jgi:hypothetical protein